MRGLAEPVLVRAVRALPEDMRDRLRHRVLVRGDGVLCGEPIYGSHYARGGQACLAFLAGLDDLPTDDVPWTARIPRGAQEAYLIMRQAVGGLRLLLDVEAEVTEADMVASIEEALG
jgi:hypothetical protein